MNGNVNNKSVTVQSGKLLGDILAAHDIGDFVMQVESVSPASPMLERGAVVCRLANGFVTLAGAEATTPADVWGVVLDYQIDPAAPESTASVARSGVFDATQLVVDAGQNLAEYEIRMRDRGLFIEKLAQWAVPTP